MQDLIKYIEECIESHEHYSEKQDDFHSGMAQMARQILSYIKSRDFDPRNIIKFKEIEDYTFQDIYDILSAECSKHRYSICETYPYLLQLPSAIKPTIDSFNQLKDYIESHEPVLQLRSFKDESLVFKRILDIDWNSSVYCVVSENKWFIRINLEYRLDKDFESEAAAENYLLDLMNSYNAFERRLLNGECDTGQ